MIRSMTGYGEAERDSPAGRLRLEVKTVNHRFFNASIKTPSGFDRFERDVSEVLKEHLPRGHVSAYMTLDRATVAEDAAPRVDLDRAWQVHRALEALQAELDLPGSVDLAMIARFSEIFRAPDVDRTDHVDAETIRALAADAGAAARAMREAEGEHLRTDLAERLMSMTAALDGIEERAPMRLTSERDRLREAVKELAEQVHVDEDRLAKEIAYLAEKWDISEETVRFRSHLEQFNATLDGDGSEPVGKRLSFLVQEMHREANTIGSKANDVEISSLSIALKEDIERIREQVENVE